MRYKTVPVCVARNSRKSISYALGLRSFPENEILSFEILFYES